MQVLEPRLNRTQRSQGKRLVRGLLLVMFLAGIGGGLGLAFNLISGVVPGSWVLEVALIAALLGQGTVLVDGIGAAGRLSEDTTSEDGDRFQETRDDVEALAHGFIDRGVAPVFWFLLLGLPGLLTYRAIEVTASEVGEWNRKSLFGWAAARCYDVVNLLPATLGSLFLIVAGVFVPGANPLPGLGVMVRRGGAFPSFSQGWPVAAVAGLLGLSLGGPRPKDSDQRVYARSTEVPWIGSKSGRAMLTAADLRRTLFLYALGCLLVLAAILLAAVIRAA